MMVVIAAELMWKTTMMMIDIMNVDYDDDHSDDNNNDSRNRCCNNLVKRIVKTKRTAKNHDDHDYPGG